MPEGLYEAVVEVEERIILDHSTCQMTHKGRKVTATNGESLFVLKELDQEHLTSELQRIRSMGITSVAVALMHSYM